MLYILTMKKDLHPIQELALSALSGKMKNFYLVGGTALSFFYFHHRESVDLDFFSSNIEKPAVSELIGLISAKLGKKAKLVKQQLSKDKAKVLIYVIPITSKEVLKIDFVQDFVGLLKPLKVINGINVLSLEDIYVRKIHAIVGTTPVNDLIGGRFFKGGRQEAKDYYDLFCLSSVFMRLSDFVLKYGNSMIREAIVRWFRTYERLEIKTGLLELSINKKFDYIEMERHFKKEIATIIKKEVDFT